FDVAHVIECGEVLQPARFHDEAYLSMSYFQLCRRNVRCLCNALRRLLRIDVSVEHNVDSLPRRIELPWFNKHRGSSPHTSRAWRKIPKRWSDLDGTRG